MLTGGPGAGKTAVLELALRSLCKHVAVLPEAAAIVFGGGFPRRTSVPARKAAQRAIFHVQRESERLVLEDDGRGLSGESSAPSVRRGLGIEAMRARVAEMGGTIAWDRGPLGGTRVTVRFRTGEG